MSACGCGCGEEARRDFIHGHNRRGAGNLDRYRIEDRGHDTPCWIWTGPLNRRGYGRVQWKRRHTGAYRAMYERLVGEIPAGMHLDHLCRVKACVNPTHLEPVTPQENTRRHYAGLAA